MGVLGRMVWGRYARECSLATLPAKRKLHDVFKVFFLISMLLLTKLVFMPPSMLNYVLIISEISLGAKIS
jgi:hypothetical protein